MSRILVFCPEAFIVPHFAAALVTARALQDLGHEVFVSHCGGTFRRCVAMDSVSLPANADAESRAQICAQCSALSMQALGFYGLKGINFKALPKSGADDEGTLGIDFVHDGTRIGLLAGQSVVLIRKLASLDDLGEPEVALLSESAKGCRDAYDTVKTAAQTLRIDHIIAYNEYGYNLSAFMAAEKVGARWKLLFQISHQNVDRRWFSLADRLWRPMSREFQTEWGAWRDLPLPPASIDAVADDVLSRLASPGSHVYSPAKTVEGDLRERLGIPAGQKLIVAYTSGLDEQAAHNILAEAMDPTGRPSADVFENQIDWLVALAAHVAKQNDAHLVIRVHPREGANKRDRVVSKHLGLLRTALVDLPANVTVVWPQDVVSSYDLMEAADLVLISWSTVGLEAARLGVPVVAAFKTNHVYPHDVFVRHAPDRNAYFRLVDEEFARCQRSDLLRVLLAFRWYTLTRFARSVYLGDVVPDANFTGFPPYVFPKEARDLETSLLDSRALERRRRIEAQARTYADRDAEVARLRFQLRRITHFLMTGAIRDDDSFLEVTQSGGASRPLKAGEFRLELSGDRCRYVGEGVDMTRYSPMARRLGLLCAQIVAPDV